MDILVMAAQLILGLSILVFFHELGHYAAARAFGIKVEKFYLFFDAWGVKLFSFKRGETEYGIGWLPLGGYVKIAGMIDESMDSEQMQSEPKPWEFRSKPVWQRLIVMVAGVVVNAILAVFIFAMSSYHYGEKFLPVSELKNGIVADSLGKEIGLQTGDKIVAINGKAVERFEDITSPKVLLGSGVVLNVDRNGQLIDIPIPENFADRFTDSKDDFITPRMTFSVFELESGSNAEKAGLKPGDRIVAINQEPFVFFDKFQKMLLERKSKKITLSVLRGSDTVVLNANVTAEGKLGFRPQDDFRYDSIQYSFLQSFPAGTRKGINTLRDQLQGMKKLVQGKVSPSKSLQGPVGIAKIYGPTWIWSRFWTLTGLISMILAVMNLLPIPALDGGHVVFLLIEAVKGSPLSIKFQERAQTVGMVLLLTLMVFVVINDFLK